MARSFLGVFERRLVSIVTSVLRRKIQLCTDHNTHEEGKIIRFSKTDVQR